MSHKPRLPDPIYQHNPNTNFTISNYKEPNVALQISKIPSLSIIKKPKKRQDSTIIHSVLACIDQGTTGNYTACTT